MNDVLLSEALRLVERPYQIEVEREPGKLPPDVPRYTACVKEMPFCVAQGFSEEEARREVRSVLVDYILSLLDRNIPVPPPELVLSGNEPDYAVHWLWEGCFLHASKSFIDQFASQNEPL